MTLKQWPVTYLWNTLYMYRTYCTYMYRYSKLLVLGIL